MKNKNQYDIMNSDKDLLYSYDAFCKQMIANKMVLAHILKRILPALKYHSLETIAASIDSQIRIAKENVHSNIYGLSQKDPNGEITYDVFFSVHLPNTENTADLLVNIEAQSISYPKKRISNRASYYTAGMLFNQYGKTFKGQRYEDLKPVYTIWIFTDPPKKMAGKITWNCHYMKEEKDGRIQLKKASKLMNEIFIYLDHSSKDELIRMLTVLLDDKMEANTRIEILEDNYDIRLKGEVRKVCNLSQRVLKRGRQEGLQIGKTQGKEQAILESIRSLMKNLNFTTAQAMDALGLSESEQQKFLTLLKN